MGFPTKMIILGSFGGTTILGNTHIYIYFFFFLLLVIPTCLSDADAIDISGGHLGGVPLDQPRPWRAMLQWKM